MDPQLLIKLVLLLGLGAIALLILWPGRGARRLALRRISLLFLVACAAVAVVFPQLSNAVATLFGVGRGADLLLYGLVVCFVGYVIATRAHHSRVDLQVTELARAQALARAVEPGSMRG
ncbi:DUF2304 domain-containing protein [Cryobacterium sp. Hb1]|uniref:DUF2304 domain-containing protein n=1 Tax=Cryobacterium sp. Hb1 TaxID=1259147 RepID=UPI001069FCEB|nr:DUF2304 domain-containing protein [Cryobacterium sp. Hb1]